MKKIIMLFTVLLFLTNITDAQKRGFGVGIIIGEPTGLSFKSFISGTTAIDGAAAWSFSDHHSAFHLHVDYLVHSYDLINVQKGRLPFYFGIGARVKAADDAQFGVRIPVGLSYEFQSFPSDIFLELAPIMDLAPATKFRMNGAIGIRFYIQ